ncbi:MAG: class I SAM-dependent methyltransferase [Alphaproteobacteria bacterium]
MELDEAERQLLATLHIAEVEATPADRAALEARGARYWIFLEDWSTAFSSLRDKGLLDGDADGFRLTEAGRPRGESCHRERPDRYWYYYQRLYPASHASAAHSRLCEAVYGEDLCQEGQADMAALGDLLARLDLKPGDRLLDLGCGSGVTAEYIAEQTGAEVTGLDYAASAITEATHRTAGNDRLTFIQADLNAFEFPARAFDAAISIDGLYGLADLAGTLSKVVGALKPGGQMGLFMSEELEDGEPLENLGPGKTRLARALAKLGLSYQAFDYTAENAAFWHRLHDAATALSDDFEAEGNGFIAANLIREAEVDFLPLIAAGRLSRHLYHVRL